MIAATSGSGGCSSDPRPHRTQSSGRTLVLHVHGKVKAKLTRRFLRRATVQQNAQSSGAEEVQSKVRNRACRRYARMSRILMAGEAAVRARQRGLGRAAGERESREYRLAYRSRRDTSEAGVLDGSRTIARNNRDRPRRPPLAQPGTPTRSPTASAVTASGQPRPCDSRVPGSRM